MSDQARDLADISAAIDEARAVLAEVRETPSDLPPGLKKRVRAAGPKLGGARLIVRRMLREVRPHSG